MQTWRLSSFYFFYFAALGIIAPYWALYLKHTGFNAEEIGQLMSIIMLTKIIAPNIWGALADRSTQKNGNSTYILRFATGICFVIFLAMFWSEGFWSVAWIMIGFCFFWNATLPQLEAATLGYVAEDKHRYGHIRLWGSVGFIITVLLLGKLIDELHAGIVVPAIAICFFIIWLNSLVMPATRRPVAKIDIGAFKNILKGKILWLFLFCALMQMSHAPFYTFFSIYLEDYGYSKTVIGWLWTAGVICEIGIFIVIGFLFKQFKLHYLLCFSFLVAGLRWLLLANFPENVQIVLLSQVMHAVTFGLYHATTMQLIHQHFKGNYQVRGQALYSSITYGIGGATGSWISGYIWTIYGSQQLFAMSGLLMLTVAVISIFVLRK